MRDAATPFLYEKFYSGSRFDALIGGSNMELTNRLTLQRRPGHLVYNSQNFPSVNSFYSFRTFSANTEQIFVMADTASTVYNATGPSTQTAVFSKSVGAGQAFLQSVGSTLYMGDGVDLQKWMQPGLWTAQTSYATSTYAVGTTIIDSNGNLQYLSSAVVGSISNVQVSGNVAIITFTSTNFILSAGQTFSTNAATATFLNGLVLKALAVTVSGGSFVVTATLYHAPYASTPDSGTASSTDVGTAATTGNSQPTWNVAGFLSTTTDGNSTWTNFGAPVYNFGPPPAPTQAPGIDFGAFLGLWLPSTAIGTEMMDKFGDIQSSTINGGVTGTKYPNFLQANTGNYPSRPFPTNDNGQTWFGSLWLGGANGPLGWKASTAIAAGQPSGGDVIVDTNGNLQMATSGSGNTSGSQPTWSTAFGGTTTDAAITWTNRGPYNPLAFQGWKYGYSYHCVDGSVSSMSPLSVNTSAVGAQTRITGRYSADHQVDSVWIFRTTDGGATPLFLFSIPNNPFGTNWQVTDNWPDSVLNLFIQGPQGGINNPPPAGLINLTYHLARVWGSVANTVYFSGGPNTLTGNGNTAFSAANSFVFPSKVTRLMPNANGLLVFTLSDLYLIAGTTVLTFYAVPFVLGLGLLSWNALDVNGSLIYCQATDGHVISLDPSSGISEIGFPIGDIFDTTFNPANTYVAWHVSGSRDKALYVANGSTGWFRMNPTSAPESGLSWSPAATIASHVKAVASIEVTPGVKKLLLGPFVNGQILMRDLNTWADNGSAYTCSATIGSIVLAQPGDLAELSFLTTECTATGSHPSVSLLLDEISGTFTTLPTSTWESPPLPASNTIYADRFYITQDNLPALCRHLQWQISFPAEAFGNELLTYTIFGRHLTLR